MHSLVIATSYTFFKNLSRSIKEHCKLLDYLEARGQVLFYRGGRVYVDGSELRDWQILGGQTERTCRLLNHVQIRNKAFLPSKRRGNLLRSGSCLWIPSHDVWCYPQILLGFPTYQHESNSLLCTSNALDYVQPNCKILHQQAALRSCNTGRFREVVPFKQGQNRACGLVV